MNLLLFEPAELVSGGAADPESQASLELELAADDRRAHHLQHVLRARLGQSVRAGVIGGATGRAEIVALGQNGMRLRVTLDGPTSPQPLVDLVLAVPRPKVLPRVLETSASFGVRRIDLVNAWRVDRSYLGSPRLGRAELAAALRRGCEQGATTWLPEVELHTLLVPFLRRAPARWADIEHRIIAHPRASSPVESIMRPGSRPPAVVAVGPEGGWIDREVDSFAALGFTPVCIGPAVLRVEAAVAGLLAQVQLLFRLQG